MSQVKKTGPQFDQGEGGGGATKASGSHTEPAGDVKRRGSTGAKLAPHNITTRATGSKFDQGPNVPGSDQTAQRGGGTNREGSDRTKGSKSSGSKFDQHPNVKA